LWTCEKEEPIAKEDKTYFFTPVSNKLFQGTPQFIHIEFSGLELLSLSRMAMGAMPAMLMGMTMVVRMTRVRMGVGAVGWTYNS
jgi:hypothetical protein